MLQTCNAAEDDEMSPSGCIRAWVVMVQQVLTQVWNTLMQRRTCQT